MTVPDAAGAPAVAVAVAAPAKVNLSLRVLGRRPDGYHLLDSLIVFAGCGDSLEAWPAEGLSLEVVGPFAAALAGEPAGADNLVLRAARLLAGELGEPRGARLRLTKRLPVAAGLGGGSADAAATLRALLRLWGLSLDPAALRALGAKLGADVPVCLYGRPAYVGGIGETIKPAPALPPAWLLLVNPGVPLSTPKVFQAREGAFSAAARWDEAPADLPALAALLAAGGNDLEAPARRLCPAVGEVLAALAEIDGCRLARMSGSGATCFGLFGDAQAARAGARVLSAAHPGWWVEAAPMLPAES